MKKPSEAESCDMTRKELMRQFGVTERDVREYLSFFRMWNETRRRRAWAGRAKNHGALRGGR